MLRSTGRKKINSMVYLHFVAMYFLWLMVTTAFSTSFMVSSLVILIFLFLIIRNNIVAAEVFKIDFEDLRRQSGWAPDWFTLVYMTLFWFCVFWTWFQKSFISNILIWPTVNFPKITLAFNILTVMIFIILYAFFLTSTFQIVTYVLFIIVYWFTVILFVILPCKIILRLIFWLLSFSLPKLKYIMIKI